MEVHKIPAFSITPNKVVLYSRFVGANPGRQADGYENLRNNENITGELSDNAIRRMRKAVDYMFYLAGTKAIKGKEVIVPSAENLEAVRGRYYEKDIKYRLNFITLTLPAPQVHSDKVIKATLLNHFLTDLHRKFKVDNYIWKAEKQKNGNIHFHILADKYIHSGALQKTWNRILNTLGYIDRYQKSRKEFYKNGFQINRSPYETRSVHQQYQAYKRAKKNDFTDPPSTNIHALRDVRNIKSYITKYLSKSVDKGNKTRKDQMLELRETIAKIKEEINGLIFDPRSDPADLRFNENYLIQLELEFQKLKDMGIEGRIWGVSQTISKLKTLGDLGDPPDMEIITEIGTRFENPLSDDNIVVTYYFDMNKTPNLKNYFDQYIYLQRFGSQILKI